jgi:hypothetical protein
MHVGLGLPLRSAAEASAGTSRPRAILRSSCLAAMIAVAVVSVGCSKSSSKPTTTADWANGLCSSISTWQGAMASATGSLKPGNLSKSSLQTTADNVKSATSTFESDVKKLGVPPTKAGTQAQQSVQTLSQQVGDSVQKIETAVGDASGVSGILSAISVVSTTLITMGLQVTSTYQHLQTLDPTGELTDALTQAPACKTLVPTPG